jgi:nucleoid-associated protein YgaU
MSAWGAIGPGTRVLIVVLGGAAAVGIGYLGWQAFQPDAAVPDAAAVEAAPETVAAPETAAAPAPAAAPAAVAAPDLPRIDTWRVAPDGQALVAGLAAPGAGVEVIVDDRPVAEGTALASGEFVLQFTLPPNPAPSLLRLAMTPPGGTQVMSSEMVALAPIAGPKLAEVAPEPATPTEDVSKAVTAEDAAPAALLLTEKGAVVLQDESAAKPMPDAQVMIDAISYAPSGEVQIGGRGAAGSTLRLYLDNAEAAVATVPETGRWLVTLGDTAPGIYMLRVDQIDAQGKVSSRFETPFKRETLEALALAANAPAAKPEADPATDPAAGTAPEAAPTATAEPLPEPAVEPAAGDAFAAADPAAAPTTAVEAAAEAVQVADAEPVAEPVVQPGPDPAPEPEPTPESLPVSITVQPGFTLWGIAQNELGDGVLYVQVFEANREKIKNPDLIYPGQVFSMPAAAP